MFKKITLFSASMLVWIAASTQNQRSYTSGEIQLALKKLNTVGSVLFIAAHPDDENTRLLSYLANEKTLRAGYLSLTRGDGGQNLIGTEQSEQLGIIRTQELLAARKVDGAEQFFTRANDFGFSKNQEETFAIWGKEHILSDVVWVIRNFRPDVIICRFPSNGDGGHGHHTASGILAEEAFVAAADPSRFPEQLKYVPVWKTKRLFWNSFIRDPKQDVTGLIKLDVGVYNPLLGKSHGELAAESRSNHKSQGFGTARNRGPVPEYFKFLKGDEAKGDIFEGFDFSWKRLWGTDKLASLLELAYQNFKPEKPEAIVPFLVEAYYELDKLGDVTWKSVKKKELESLILACSGIFIDATSADYIVVPGNEIKINASFVKRSNLSVILEKIMYPGDVDTLLNKNPVSSELVNAEKNIRIPENISYSIPYWLDEKTGKGIFTVNDQQLVGVPENKYQVNVFFYLLIADKKIIIKRPVQYKWVDPVDGEQYRNLEVIPPVAVNLAEGTCLVYGTQAKKIQVMLKAGKTNVSGKLSLNLPAVWNVQPASVNFELKNKEEEQVFFFTITPPKNFHTLPAQSFFAIADVEGKKYTKGLLRIKHKHIPVQTLFPEAEAKVVPLELKIKGKKVAYIPGAGDEIPACLKLIGYDVTILSDEMLEAQSLSGYDAIITGIRLYNTSERMKFHYKKLMDYVSNGGTMLVQYNTNNFLSNVKSEIGPYPFKISRDRVTVEEAPVNIELPEHPLLNTPNKITAKDFDGWIQERGIYFASEWDTKYETPFSCNDPGEKSSKGSTIIAKQGKGYFVYTGLAFFRELPAGVPGAYRLFVNMISLK